jgi:hypothetical protein
MSIDALFIACDNYQAMQQAHLSCLDAGTPPDIEQLVFEREQCFADLQNHLTALLYQVHTPGIEPALLPNLQSRLTALLEREAILATRLQVYRGTLERERAQIQQGQKVLLGYGHLVPPRSPRLVDTSR